MKLSRSIIALFCALFVSPALAQSNQGASPLTGRKGGTNNAFMQFTGPASSMKTYTLPNASDTICTLNAPQGFTAAKTFSDLTLLLAGSSSGTTTLKASAAASGVLTLPAATDTLVARNTADTFTNKTLDTAAAGNSLRINGLAATDNTGTGKLVRDTSPTLVTPTLGAASATSINKVAITAPATGATLTIPDGVTITAPAATDTLVGRSSTDTLANKSIDTASNTFKLNGTAFGTASQATAALNVMVGDTGTGGTKGLVPAPGAGDAAAGKVLGAGGEWVEQTGGGGSGGISDTDRRNFLLSILYQSRLGASYRRLVNLFATGFRGANDAANGINTGSSSNYSVDTSGGKVSATASSGAEISRTDGTTIGNMTERGGIAAAFDGTFSKTAASSAGKTAASGFVGKDYGSGVTHQIGRFLVYAPSNSTYTANGGGTVTIELRGNSSAPSTGSEGTLLYSSAATQAAANVHDITTGITASPFRYIWVRIIQSSAAEVVIAQVRFFEVGSIDNMTLVTAAQTSDAAVSNGRILLDFDNSVAPTLNSDVTAEVTCDGGSNWASATLSLVTAYSQGGRSVAETTDTPCTAGTSFAARIKTMNDKLIQIYGVSLQSH